MEDADVEAVARRLVSGGWLPNADELALGQALVLRTARLEEELRPADMPPTEDQEPLWLTQVLVGQSALVQEVTEELLPVWRRRLAGSPMLDLVGAYVEALRPLQGYALRMLGAWSRRPPARPDPGRIARYAVSRGVSPDRAGAELWHTAVRRWEDGQLSAFEDDDVAVCEQRAMLVGAVLSMAVSLDGPGGGAGRHE